VGSISYWPPKEGTPWLDQEFEDLRAAYLKRMRSDRDTLMVLRALLRDEATNANVSREALRLTAHRMAGAAAIFESRELLINSALTLEHAAHACMNARSFDQEAKLLAALDALLSVLDAECSGASNP
jgi:hypothetical protein